MTAFRWKQKFSTTSGAATKAFWEIICPENTRIVPIEISITVAGVSVTDKPIQFEICLVGTAGVTPVVSTSLTNEDRDNGLTRRTTVNDSWATDPVAGDVLSNWNIHPQSGIIYPWPTRELTVWSVTDTLGYMLRSVSPSVDVNVQGYIIVEE